MAPLSRCRIRVAPRFTASTIAAVLLCLTALAACAGGGNEAPPPDSDSPLLVNEDWRIIEMATAHGAFTIEVEAADGVDTAAISRTLIEPLQARYAEVLVYFHRRGAPTDLPAVRVQWTAGGGYAETRFEPPARSALPE